MPLIKPEIQKVLRASGLLEEKEDSLTIDESLTRAGLDASSIAEELTILALHSSNDALRLRALETALKVKGALKEQSTVALPSFNIIIQNSSTQADGGVNPILLPRLGSRRKEPLESESERPN